MKKLLSLIVVLNILIACGGSGGGDNPPDPEVEVNEKPTTPSITYPTSSDLCEDNYVNFKWNTASDPNGDSVSYQLQIATNSSFSANVKEYPNLSGTSKSVSLDKGTAYYWRVKAVDSKNLSGDYTSGVQFYTEGVGVSNYLPFMPELVSPAMEEAVTDSSVILEWTAEDVDNDSLTFDVYFGEDSNSLPVVSENQTATTFTKNVSDSTTYYWKIAVKDGQSGTTIGQVWSFTTD
ncbi:hypothetical protein R3X25_02010 [Lutibacter sp. TH_r2]|uniref:hypothetical protein n=1 Tax=Lutibacter sp. TH_r2 TaxID=3082083 RepID=UPI0029544583|nr:hypothetical protein [Lutibacter sp. TH_r2]MDV7186042.1 hypothetical protein [Lutibacter sp. TH_r2]